MRHIRLITYLSLCTDFRETVAVWHEDSQTYLLHFPKNFLDHHHTSTFTELQKTCNYTWAREGAPEKGIWDHKILFLR